MLSAAVTLSYALGQIPAGFLSDRLGPGRLFFIGLLGWSVLSVCFGLIHTFWLAMLSQFVAGAFRALMFAPGLALLASWFPPQRRATAMSLYMLGGFAGTIVLSLGGPLLTSLYGWRAAFMIFAALGIGAAFVYKAYAREKPRAPAQQHIALSDIFQLFRFPIMWVCSGLQFVRFSVVTSFNFWLPSLLVADRGLSMQTAGLVIAMSAAFTAPSNTVGGYVSDRFQQSVRQYRRLPYRLCAGRDQRSYRELHLGFRRDQRHLPHRRCARCRARAHAQSRARGAGCMTVSAGQHRRDSGFSAKCGLTRQRVTTIMRIHFLSRIPARRAAVAAFAAIGIAAASLAAAQSYPSKPVRVIAPFPPGGSSDLVARILSQKLGEALGQQFIVENRPGAGGTLGTEIGARAAPDGYTLIVGNISPLAVNPNLSRKLAYDPINDFAPIALSAVGTTVLVVHPSLPVRTVKELIALAKAKPGQLNYGSGGSGTPSHLTGELFRHMAKVNIVHVPYKGTGLSLTDLIAGQIQFVFASTPVGLPHVKTGKLRALAVTSEKRSALAPELPTVSEAGVPGFTFDSWWGLTAPARTPNDIIMRLNGQLLQIVQQADVKERFAALGLEPAGTSPQQYAAFIKSEIDKVARIVKLIGLQPE